jgi:hypothetical protein
MAVHGFLRATFLRSDGVEDLNASPNIRNAKTIILKISVSRRNSRLDRKSHNAWTAA